MSPLLIEPHYLGSLEYFCLLSKHKQVMIDVEGPFEKQRFLNRAYFLTANKVQPLVVPVSRASGPKIKDAVIEYSHRWVKDHWGALYSGYGKAPFFEYFQDEFDGVWRSKPSFLLDLNLEMLRRIIRMVRLDVELLEQQKESSKEWVDFRRQISPKKPAADRKIYHPVTYAQLFGNTFVPNLSIVDLIMCEGPNTAQILSASIQK